MKKAKHFASLSLVLLAVAACASAPPPQAAVVDEDEIDASRHHELCSDPQWREQHLGLWYNLCSEGGH